MSCSVCNPTTRRRWKIRRRVPQVLIENWIVECDHEPTEEELDELLNTGDLSNEEVEDMESGELLSIEEI